MAATLPSTNVNVHNTFHAVSIFALSVLANLDTRPVQVFADDEKTNPAKDENGNDIFEPSELDAWLHDPKLSPTGVLKCLHATALPDGSPCVDAQNAIGVVLTERQDAIIARQAEIEKMRAQMDALMAEQKELLADFSPVTRAAAPAPTGVKSAGKSKTVDLASL